MRKQLLTTFAAASVTLLAGISALAQPYSNQVMTLNPVAYWPLGETTAPAGGLYVANNSGTLGAAGQGYYETWWQTNGVSNVLFSSNSIVHVPGALLGDSDTALQQGAVGQYVVIPRVTNGVANPAVTLVPPFSIEMWVYPTNNSASQLKPILAEGFNNVHAANYATVNQGTALGMYSGFIYFNTFNGSGNGGTGKTEIDTVALVMSNWYHIVATFDGTTQRLYTNGVQVGSGKAPGVNSFGTNYVPDLTSPLIIGGGNNLGLSGGANALFGGAIDEVAIYKSTLSSTTISNHFNNGTNSARVTPYATLVGNDSPAIYLRLNEAAFSLNTDPTSYPAANNYGTLGALAKGYYLPGATPGVAGPTNSGFGASSRAVALNGFNSAVAVGGGNLPVQLNPTANQPFTVSGWFKGNPSDCVQRLQAIVGHGDASFRLNLDNNGSPQYNPGNGPQLAFGSVAEELAAGIYVNDGSWHFAAGVSDGTNDSLYIDGMLVKSAAGAGAVAGSGTDILLGGDSQYTAPQPLSVGGGGRWFAGSLAQIALFTNALAASQIQGLYAAAGVAPSFRVQPVSQGLNAGTAASIPATVSGSSPISYQWYKNGSVASGQNTSALTFPSVTTGNAGSYYLIANNTYGSATSAVIQVTVFQPNTYSYAVRQLGPVGYWPLNETAQPGNGYYIATNQGTAGTNATGYYQTWYQPATINGKATFYPTNFIQRVTGPLGDANAALSCGYSAGAGQYVVVPHATNGVDNEATTVSGSFTVELWVKTTNLTGGLRPIVSQGRNPIQGDATKQYTNTYRGFSLGQFNAGLYFGVYDNNHKDHNGQPSVNIANMPSNVWVHVAAVYDSSASSITFFSNGVQVATASGATMVPDTVSPLLIGTGTTLPAGNGGTEFTGALDDVAIYATALSQAQIQAHVAATTPSDYKTAVRADNPTIYYRMDEPAFNSYPSASSYPVATNYGSLGNAANGAYLPGTTPGVAGPGFGGFGASTAVAFNGFYGAVDVGSGAIPAALNPTGTQPLTVSAWFQGNPADAPARSQEIVSHGGNSWRLGISNSWAGAQFNSGTNTDMGFADLNDMVTNNLVCNDGNWHMMVGVFDGANDYLYVDGRLAKSRTGAKPIPGSVADFWIGGSPDFNAPNYNTANRIRTFAGQVAQVAFFTNALSAPDIQSLYNAAGVPLSIVSQPQSTQISAGTTTALMSFGVSGSSPVYQWYLVNTNTMSLSKVNGQTNASLIFPGGVALGNAGSYLAIATNAFNSVTSAVAQLTVVGPPVLTERSPATIKVFAGTAPVLHVTAIGPSLSYYWKSNGVATPAINGPDYPMTTNGTRNVGTTPYLCTVSNSFGTVPVNFSVEVLADPTTPYPVRVLADQPVAYFRLNETPDDGQGNNGLTVWDYAGGNNGGYTNAYIGLGGYSATDPDKCVEFGDFPPNNDFAGFVPSYLNFSTTNGGNAQFSVEAWVYKYAYLGNGNCIVALGTGNGGEQFVLDTGNGAGGLLRFFVRTTSGVSYHANGTNNLIDSKWHHVVGVCDQPNGKLYIYLDGVLTGTGTIPVGAGVLAPTAPMSIGARQSGSSSPANYDFQFIGMVDEVALYGSALSTAQVQAHYYASGVGPTITSITPPSADVNQGGSASFTVAATGTTPFTYTWYDNNSQTISGQTTATLTLNNLQQSQSGTYSVVVANTYGSSSTNFSLNVNLGPPVITVDLQPTNVTAFTGASQTFSVTASGSLPFTYKWYRNGSLISGANSPSYTFNVLAGTNAYYCTVQNSYGGPVPSSTATVAGMPSPTLNPNDYYGKMKITFKGYNRSETLSDFPALVRLSPNLSGFSYGQFASPTGGDLRFTDAGGTRVIPHEIDEWNTSGESTAWVQVPALSGTNDYIWAYWGNAAATTPLPGTNVWMPQTWEGLPAYKLVYHMSESELPMVDSTFQHHTIGGVAPTLVTGVVGAAGGFNGTSTYLNAGQILDVNGMFTLSSWVYINTNATDEQVLWRSKLSGGWNGDGFQMFVNQYQTTDKMLRIESGNGVGGAAAASAVGAVSYGQWHYVAATFNTNNGRARVFLDGADITSSSGLQADCSLTNVFTIGGPNFVLDGAMDEVRMQAGTNTANWIWASYMTVAANNSFQQYDAVNYTGPSGVKINYQVINGKLVLTWPQGTLQQATSLTGTWTPMTGVTSPYTNNMTGSGYYKIR